jgi:excisionase family DNA binding protein
MELENFGRPLPQGDDMGDPLPLRDVPASSLLLTPEEAAQVLRVGRTTIYALMKADEVRPVHIGRSCRISRAELERYVRRLESPRPSAAQRPSRRRRAPPNQGGLFDFAAEPVDRR